MIQLKAYKIMTDEKTNKEKMYEMSEPTYSWDNDHNFGFDIFKPILWRDYLGKNFVGKDRRPLPSKTKEGLMIVYEVKVIGSPTWMKQAVGRDGTHDGIVSLFPGYNKDGMKRDVKVQGIIRDVRTKRYD